MYRPDHTAHIRAELARSAWYFAAGLFVVLAAAGATFVVVEVVGGSSGPVWLGRALWIAGSFAFTVSLAGLLVVLLRWWWYLRRRAELDAAGAVAVGELYARLANRRRPEP
ncbi:hypothetical protein KZZ52_57230 [Dactylosporangium sp. AC04546]|uniref:hypothetical protein n=1 Tax=Dactylosporangium sp. AC04546 TaxID=2862460 RepID=UPI001EDDEE94|nr:hypothetical protein [Dactylosporangium sp. AC04546]WVK83355.1 hypothetical protein KZZ52_57230 [Dactylosporangium sp. AC04546]